jgi:hypothetical protein
MIAGNCGIDANNVTEMGRLNYELVKKIKRNPFADAG